MSYNAVIALGSNLGCLTENLNTAISKIRSQQIAIDKISSFWRSEAEYMVDDSGDFLNAMVLASTRLEPRLLLEYLQHIEAAMGRPAKHKKNITRIIDLDIIALGDLQINEPNLIVPHAKAAERLFVLLPLQEILPGYVLPGQALPVEALIAQAPTMKIHLQ